METYRNTIEFLEEQGIRLPELIAEIGDDAIDVVRGKYAHIDLEFSIEEGEFFVYAADEEEDETARAAGYEDLDNLLAKMDAELEELIESACKKMLKKATFSPFEIDGADGTYAFAKTLTELRKAYKPSSLTRVPFLPGIVKCLVE